MSERTEPCYVIGLTGGIASGKSAASDEFAQLGALVVDVDVISRDLSAPGGRAVSTIISAFPDCTTQGGIDRAKLRQRVFSDSSARRTLEDILHPLIREETLKQIENASASDAPYILLVVPLLFESKAYQSITAASIVVDVPASTQLERLHTQRGIEDQTARSILAVQLSREARLRHAQFVLDNTRCLNALRDRVRVLHSVLCANARATALAMAGARAAA